MAVQPLEKDCSNNQTLAAATAEEGAGGGIATGTGCPTATMDLKTPNASAASKLPINKEVGNIKMMPACRIPRRLINVMSTKMLRHSSRVCGRRFGSAETSAPTPAEIPTATVKM